VKNHEAFLCLGFMEALRLFDAWLKIHGSAHDSWGIAYFTPHESFIYSKQAQCLQLAAPMLCSLMFSSLVGMELPVHRADRRLSIAT